MNPASNETPIPTLEVVLSSPLYTPNPAINSATTAHSTHPIAYQLRDIHGLDPLPWWPPAIGWWLLIGAIFLGLWLVRHRLPRAYSRILNDLAWRWDAANKLRSLRWRVRRQEAKVSASELSELLRRIAMARYGRDACAGLTGMAWLQWLMAHDPVGYAWPERGQLLLALPYTPPHLVTADTLRLLELIDATKQWLSRTQRLETQHANV